MAKSPNFPLKTTPCGKFLNHDIIHKKVSLDIGHLLYPYSSFVARNKVTELTNPASTAQR